MSLRLIKKALRRYPRVKENPKSADKDTPFGPSDSSPYCSVPTVPSFSGAVKAPVDADKSKKCRPEDSLGKGDSDVVKAHF